MPQHARDPSSPSGTSASVRVGSTPRGARRTARRARSSARRAPPETSSSPSDPMWTNGVPGANSRHAGQHRTLASVTGWSSEPCSAKDRSAIISVVLVDRGADRGVVRDTFWAVWMRTRRFAWRAVRMLGVAVWAPCHRASLTGSPHQFTGSAGSAASVGSRRPDPVRASIRPQSILGCVGGVGGPVRPAPRDAPPWSPHRSRDPAPPPWCGHAPAAGRAGGTGPPCAA